MHIRSAIYDNAPAANGQRAFDHIHITRRADDIIAKRNKRQREKFGRQKHTKRYQQRTEEDKRK